MTPEAYRDIKADALALITAAHEGDGSATGYLLGVCNQPGVIKYLAVLAEEVLGALAQWNQLEDSELMCDLRKKVLGPADG